MALSASTVWEIRGSNGTATAGGGYVAGSGTTDYSQQNSPQLTVTDAACTGNTTVTSVTGGFTAAMVGNIMYLSSGPGWYQIATRVDTNTITIDRNGPNATGMTANVGGALDAVATAAAIWVAGNKGYCKGSETRTATTTLSNSAVPAHNAMPNRLIGYTTTRSDRGQYTITLSTNTGLSGLSVTGNGWWVENIAIDCADLGTSTAFNVTGDYTLLLNCKASQFTVRGIYMNGAVNGVVHECEVTDGTSAGTAGISTDGSSAGNLVCGCNVHDNACPGIVTANASICHVCDNLVTKNTGASSDGINAGYSTAIRGNTVHGNGRHGIYVNSSNGMISLICRNNSLSGNGGYGFQLHSASGTPAHPNWDGNAYGYPANTSGARNNCDSVTGVNAESPYTNVYDVTVSAGTQYVDTTTDDYDLNATASQGALLRGAGLPETWPGNASTSSNRDLGASQHADSAGGGTTGRQGLHSIEAGAV